MKPSILIQSEGAIVAAMAAALTVQGKAHLFATGLAGAEEVEVDLCVVDAEPDVAVEAQWMPFGTLSVSEPTLLMEAPGNYRVQIAASAGAVSVGVYGG